MVLRQSAVTFQDEKGGVSAAEDSHLAAGMVVGSINADGMGVSSNGLAPDDALIMSNCDPRQSKPACFGAAAPYLMVL